MSIDKTKYVLGFLFNEERNHVALIRKNKPEWQSGMLNGVGGKVEYGEFPWVAMEREFEEESGVKITNWHRVAILNGIDFIVHVFSAFSDEVFQCRSMTEERVQVVAFEDLQQLLDAGEMINNLSWLIPMSLDNDNIFSSITYK